MSDEDVKDENVNSTNDTADDAQASDTDTNDDAQDDSGSDSADDSQTGSDDVEKLKQLNKKLFERAKKAEDLAKKLKTEVKKPVAKAEPKSESDLSTKDVIALAKSNIHDDDISEVLDYSKFKKISVSEALKSEYIQTFVRDSEEKRKSANAANTGGSRRSTTKLSDEAILNNFEKGEMPESKEDMARLAALRLKQRHS